MVKKGTFIVILVLILVTLTIGVWFAIGKFKPSSQIAAEPNKNAAINELMAEGNPLKCISLAYDLQSVKKTIYVQAGLARIDSEIKIDGKVILTHEINKDGYQYSWPLAGDPNKGIKANIATIASEAPAAYDANQGFGLDRKMDLNCSSWLPDASFFIVPGNITFDDTTEQAKNNTGIGASVP
jgi:hypothetical protein